jgi:hypothetical protein
MTERETSLVRQNLRLQTKPSLPRMIRTQLLVILLVAAPALAQEMQGIQGPVGVAPRSPSWASKHQSGTMGPPTSSPVDDYLRSRGLHLIEIERVGCIHSQKKRGDDPKS